MLWGGRKTFVRRLCVLLFISFQLFSFSSASFLPKSDKFQRFGLFESQEKDLNFSVLNMKRYDYQQIALETLLARNNFSVVWYEETFGPMPSFILHHCLSKSNQTTLPCSLNLYNIDGSSGNLQELQFDLDQGTDSFLNSENSTLFYKEVPIKVTTQGESSAPAKSEKSCSSDITYYFVNKRTLKPYNYTFDHIGTLSIQIGLTKGDCGFDLVTRLLSISTKTDTSEIIKYTLIMVGIAVVQVISCGFMVRKLEQNSSIHKRTSIGTLCFLIVFDFFIYLLHFTHWTSVSLWMAVIFIAFFVAAVLVEPIVLYYLFSTLQRRTNTPALYLLFQIYCWILISGGCIILTLTCIPNFIFYAYPFFLLPQIIDNFLSGRKYKWNPWLIAGLGLPKLLYIVYLSIDPVDLFQKGFTKEMMIYSCIIIAISMGILTVQRKYPSFGIKRFLPKQYSYSCNVNSLDHSTLDVCSICTEKVTQAPIIGLQQPLMEQGEDLEIYKTPCEHHFHSECLKEWLKKKLECPNCRQMLPPLPDDEDNDDD